MAKINEHYIRKRILAYNEKHPLHGITSPARLDCLVKQIMDSIQRISHVTSLHDTCHAPHCADPTREDFNPLRAAVFHKQQGNIDEACWLAFLATHFAENEHSDKRWSHVSNVYSALGNDAYWDWKRISLDPNGFRSWLESNKNVIQSKGRFGNHRKYESLLDEHTGKTIHSYVDWIGTNHSHGDFISYMRSQVGTHPHILFDALYKSMEAVWRFGRTAKFDYLCLLGKLGLADIEPGSPYLQDATGPLSGARLLFGERKLSPAILNMRLKELGEYLDLRFVQQILEDSICNFHKSPDNYISFLR